MDGGFGPLLLLALVVLACVVALVLLLAFVAFVIFGATGFLVLKDRTESAKRRANEVEPENGW